MNNTKKTLFLCLLFALSNTACTSNKTPASYYLLEQQLHTQDLSSERSLILSPIALSDYLRNRELHVKLDDGKISYNAKHLWAEPLSSMLWRLSKNQLEAKTKLEVVRPSKAQSACATIDISIESLSPSTSGVVTTSGKWRIKSSSYTKSENFHFESPLKDNGFAASNAVVIEQIKAMTNQIATHLSNIESCD